MKQYDAIVIGSGIGGLAAGLLLASAGKKTLMLEKRPVAGGRLSSHERDGFKVDLGVHVISRSTKGPLGDLLARVGEESQVQYQKIRPVSSYNGKIFIFPHDLKQMIPAEAFDGLMRFMSDIRAMTDEEVSRCDDVDIKSVLMKYTQNDMAHACLSNLCMIYVCLPPWLTSAGEFMRCMRFEGSARASGYPVGGCEAISSELAGIFNKKGGELLLGTPAEKILIEGGRVTGVIARGEEYRAPVVVSNADLQNTVQHLAGPEHFESDYLQYIGNLQYSWSGPVERVALDTVLTDIKMLTQFGSLDQERYYEQMYRGEMPEELNLFMVSPSNFSPGVAPEGKQLINFATQIPLDLPQSIQDELPEAMMRTAEKYVPGIREHILWVENLNVRGLCGELGEHGVGIGIGQRPGQVGKNRPSVKTPVEGLYVVGGEAGGTGVGIELCINSALECFDQYLKP